MRDKQELKHLLEKYANGACSPEEIRLLEAWFAGIGQNESINELTEEAQARMLHQIQQSPRFVKSSKGKIRTWPQWKKIAVAATIAGLACVSWLFVSKNFKLPEKQPADVQLTTGYGEIRKIVLPESSVVWLNARTDLAYREDFKNDRSIRLTGEAVFEVTRDEAHPFRVRTADSIETTVLGTQFNVRSYKKIPETEVVVLDGRVKVGKFQQTPQGVLAKNEAIRFDRTAGKFVRFKEDAAAVADWRTGEWELKGTGTAALALLLYNQYGINLIANGHFLETVELNANFNKKQTAEEIVSTFCLLANCQYRWISKTQVELYESSK